MPRFALQLRFEKAWDTFDEILEDERFSSGRSGHDHGGERESGEGVGRSDVEGGQGSLLPLRVVMQQCVELPILRQYEHVSSEVLDLMLRELQVIMLGK